MAIQSVLNVSPNAGIMNADLQSKSTPAEAQKSFGAFLKDAIQDVNIKQVESDNMTTRLVMGENVELHDVMIASQKATIALNATMEIRNKVVEAYQEIIRMPV